MFFVSSCSCLCPIYRSHVLSWEWRCSWSSADRRCSNYIWVINNLIAHKSVFYIRDLMVHIVCAASIHSILALYVYLYTEQIMHYHQISNIRHTKSQNLNVSRLVFAQSIEARCQVENEDVVGAASTGDAPTTSEWSTILLPTKVRLILEIFR